MIATPLAGISNGDRLIVELLAGIEWRNARQGADAVFCTDRMIVEMVIPVELTRRVVLMASDHPDDHADLTQRLVDVAEGIFAQAGVSRVVTLSRRVDRVMKSLVAEIDPEGVKATTVQALHGLIEWMVEDEHLVFDTGSKFYMIWEDFCERIYAIETNFQHLTATREESIVLRDSWIAILRQNGYFR